MLADSAKLVLPSSGRTLWFMLMSASGQTRRFDCEPITSDLHLTPACRRAAITDATCREPTFNADVSLGFLSRIDRAHCGALPTAHELHQFRRAEPVSVG
jgi:hypothetical protein